jgi:hypothetical protein
MALTLPEEVLLLLLHDERGRSMVDGNALNAALAGAALVELTLDGALRLTVGDEPRAPKGRLVSTGRPPRDPRLTALIERMDTKKPKDAIGAAVSSGWRSTAAADLRQSLLHDLAEQGLLTEEKGRILGFTTANWPQGRRRDVEDELLARVERAVVQGEEPDARTAAVISILSVVDGLPKLFPDQDKKVLKRRGQQISESDWAAEAVRTAVQEIQAALMVMTTVVIGTAIVAS